MKRTSPHDSTAQSKILARLRSAEGHLSSVVAMVERDEYCIDVLRQTSAVRAAIAKVENLLLERHLHHCVSAAVRSDDEGDRERVIGELLDLFETAKR
jgi:CsoR family transcriptional regulator, copper-sensing transcriptional repressor